MELIIFMGLQASGKSSFYRKNFIDTHIRINLDMLKTRHRESILFNSCLEAKQSLVIDNTNPQIVDRSRYIKLAKIQNIKIVGYYFQSRLEECKYRNDQRVIKKRIPIKGIIATHKKIELPSYKEGFDKLYYVKLDTNNSFIIESWQDAI